MMYKYAYIYKFDNMLELENDITNESKQIAILNRNQYLIKHKMDIVKSNKVIYMKESVISEIWIYPCEKVFIILVEKCNEIKKISFIKRYEKLKLLSNEFINDVFKNQISNNVTKISLQLIEEYGEESFEIIGSRIMNLDIVEELEVFESDTNWEIKEISFQLMGTKFGITLSYCNRIKFNQKIEMSDVEKTIEKILLII